MRRANSCGFLSVGFLREWLIGVVTTWIQKRIDDAPIEITISLLTPFAAYLLAERLKVSGVLAVVTTGLYHGWRIPEIMTSRTRLQAGPVWQMVEFLLNGLIFLLIGLALPEVLRHLAGRSLGQLIEYAAVISAAVILIRILWVFPAAYLPRLLFPSIRARDPYPSWRNVTIVAWTGMRGVVSLAAALSLPMALPNGDPFPGRDLILFLTFEVILVTLVIQGLSLPTLIRRLGVVDDGANEKEERLARIKANEAAMTRLEELGRAEMIEADALQRLRVEYEDRLRQLDAFDPVDGEKGSGIFSTAYEKLSHEILQIERKTILH